MLIQDIQLAIGRRLREAEFFAGTPPIKVVERCSQDATATTEELVGAACGMVCLVYPVKGKFTRHNTPVPSAKLTFGVRAIENPNLNRTRGGTFAVAEEVIWAAAILHWLVPLRDEHNLQIGGGAPVLGDVESGEMMIGSTKHYFSEITLDIEAGDARRIISPVRAA